MMEIPTCTHVYNKSGIKIKCEFCPSEIKEDFSERGPKLETCAFNQDIENQSNLDGNIDLKEKYFTRHSDSIRKYTISFFSSHVILIRSLVPPSN